jgi:hypothetical protein
MRNTILLLFFLLLAPATARAYSYLGCFEDSGTRALPSYLGSGHTVQGCVQTAEAMGFRYAGLQWYGQCFAGNQVGYSLVAGHQCNTPCSADPSQMCGGAWRNSIYATRLQERYLGCFADDPYRALPHLVGVNHTVDSCTAAARAAGYAYAGLQWYGYCFAGNQLGYSQVADVECNTPCTGMPNQMCGGGWRNSVYASGGGPVELVVDTIVKGLTIGDLSMQGAVDLATQAGLVVRGWNPAVPDVFLDFEDPATGQNVLSLSVMATLIAPPNFVFSTHCEYMGQRFTFAPDGRFHGLPPGEYDVYVDPTDMPPTILAAVKNGCLKWNEVFPGMFREPKLLDEAQVSALRVLPPNVSSANTVVVACGVHDDEANAEAITIRKEHHWSGRVGINCAVPEYTSNPATLDFAMQHECGHLMGLAHSSHSSSTQPRAMRTGVPIEEWKSEPIPPETIAALKKAHEPANMDVATECTLAIFGDQPQVGAGEEPVGCSEECYWDCRSSLGWGCDDCHSACSCVEGTFEDCYTPDCTYIEDPYFGDHCVDCDEMFSWCIMWDGCWADSPYWVGMCEMSLWACGYGSC